MKNDSIHKIIDDKNSKDTDSEFKKKEPYFKKGKDSSSKNTKKNNENISNFTNNIKKMNKKWIFYILFILIIIVIIWLLFFNNTNKEISNAEFSDYAINFALGTNQNLFLDSKDFNPYEFTDNNFKSGNGNGFDYTIINSFTKKINSSDGNKIKFSSITLQRNSNLDIVANLNFTVDKKTYSLFTIYSRENWEIYSRIFHDVGLRTGIAYLTGEVEPDSTPNQYFLNNIVLLNPSNYSFILQIIFSILPIIIIGIIFYFLYRSVSKGKGMNFGLPNKKINKPQKSDIRFADVAGYDEEKYELEEVIFYLKNPKSYSSWGVRIPKGILLTGEPGTGKTLLAKAVAGESSVPFLSINGSEFVELFIGMGAQRVRDLFTTARKYSPCILFIDEIDTIAKKRGIGITGSNDEREQTLNQLLVEMDGFSKRHNVIIIGATNRFDVLDAAILRPGRFDRIITFHVPNKLERIAILKIHAKNKNMDPEIDFESLANKIPGFTGAQIENILNDAALLAIRNKRKYIALNDIDETIDRSIAGLAKKSKKYNDYEKKLVAYHESGHALAGLILSGSEKVEKITIIPRGRTGGFTLTVPNEERFFTTKKELYEKIIGYLSGRASEEIIFGKDEITTGAHNDIEQASIIVKKMVIEFGMSNKLGLVKYHDTISVYNENSGNSVGASQKTIYQIDKEVREIIDTCYQKALKNIIDNRDLLDLLARALMKFETITSKEINYIYKERKIPKNLFGFKKNNEFDFSEIKDDDVVKIKPSFKNKG